MLLNGVPGALFWFAPLQRNRTGSPSPKAGASASGRHGLVPLFCGNCLQQTCDLLFQLQNRRLEPGAVFPFADCRFLLWAERCRGYNLNSRNASGREEGPNKKRAMSY